MITPPNDWEIKKCLKFSLSFLLAMLCLLGLAALGLDITVLRQIAGFLFLTFVPGILLLRILKIHNVDLIESLVYSVGLSLAFVMATGVVVNFALPPLGISRPFTLVPLTITFTTFFLVLCFLTYKRDRNFSPTIPPVNNSPEIAQYDFRLSPFLLAILLPLLAILGAILVNAYQNNTLLLAFLFIIALLIILATLNKFITPQVYPFLIVMMAIALLYQTTFISSHLVGSDIHYEYYLSKEVIKNELWDATIPSPVNTCLSVVMLAPVYSLLLNMDIVWLFKIIYPLFFSLVPLTLFHIWRLQIKPHYAFFAAFFFTATPMFTMDLVQLIRQQIATLFFVLVILLMVDRKLTLVQRTVLAIIFSFGVAVSHYGLGTGAIGYLVLGSLLLISIKSRFGQTLWQWLIGKRHALPADLASAGAFTKKALVVFVGIFLLLTIGYYASVGSRVPLGALYLLVDILAGTGKQIVQGITKPATLVELPILIKDITTRFPFLDPMTKEPLSQTALGLDFPIASPGGKVWRIFQYLVQLCLIIGFFRLIFRPKALGEIKAEYLSLTIVSTLVLLGNFTLAHYGYGLGVTRVWFTTLLFMSPLFLFGSETIGLAIIKLAQLVRKTFASSWLTLDNSALLRFTVLILFLPYFILNSGVVFELSRNETTHFIDIPYSIALSSHRVDITDRYTVQEVTTIDWFSVVAQADYLVYADHHGSRLPGNRIEFFGQVRAFSRDTKGKLPSPSYIYLRTWNTQKRVLTFGTAYAARQSMSFDNLPWFILAMSRANKIYDNGGGQILLAY